MCTATWRYSDGHLDLLFNRDELRTRGTALPPEVHRELGVSFICPTDIDAGGTWIGVGQSGLVVCLLNLYRAESSISSASPPGADTHVSRGLLLRSLLTCTDGEAVQVKLADENLTRYRAFTILVLDPPGGTRRAMVNRWWGEDRGLEKERDPIQPLSSSSFHSAEVVSNRIEVYETTIGTDSPAGVGDLASYHRSHLPERGPYSVCMHRNDARTQSLSHIAVTAEQVAFRYAPGSPCETAFQPAVILRRKS